MYVLDASVILKWFLEEESSDKALGFRYGFISGAYNLIVPDLALYEIANALRFASHFPESAAGESISSLIDLGLDIIVPTSSLLKRSLEIAHKKKVTVYDAVYAALAQDVKYTFVTADEKLYNKIKEMGFVQLLREATP